MTDEPSPETQRLEPSRQARRAESSPQARRVESSPEAQRLAERAAEALLGPDAASRMLGIQLLEVRPGYARLTMRIRSDMVNGHRICHGGLIFTLADSAFAVSCNSHNENTVAAAASIDFLAPGSVGDELTAEANEVWRSG